MSSKKSKPENVAELADRFPKSKWQAILSVFLLISKLPLNVQLLLAAMGLGLAIVCGVMLQTILFNNQDTLQRTLAATLVSTAYPHRGVTAILTAELDKNTESETNNTDLKEAVGKIADHIERLKKFDKGWEQQLIQSLDKTIETEGKNKEILSSATQPTDRVKSPNTIETDWRKKLVQYLDLQIRDKRNIPGSENLTWTQIVYSKHMEQLKRQAFLMVPAISLREPEVGDKGLKDDLQNVLLHNPEVLFDFYIASQIQQELDNLSNVDPRPLRYVQAYFISESGVILLRQLGDSRSYGDTFPNNTLFMDRLYFWGAINSKEFKLDKNKGPLDYETEPYIDLGGNGVVKTSSKKILLPNNRTGVICVDVVLPNTQEEIVKRLTELKGTVVEKVSYVESAANSGQESKTRLEIPPGETGFDWVNNPGTTPSSRITGAIAFEEDFRTVSDRKIVRFTVPMGGHRNSNGENVTDLLLVTFDFRSIRRWTYFWAAGLVVGIGFFIFVVGNLIFQFTELTGEMDRVLVNMSNVMYEADTPFVWLNENNEFEEVNLSFLKIVGCKTKHELKQHAPKFKDLVAAEDVPAYKETLERSAAGDPTPKYQITIVTADDKKVPVWVHGERIPYPTLGRKRPPHRFGVFLPEPKADHESHSSERDSGDVTHERDPPTSLA